MCVEFWIIVLLVLFDVVVVVIRYFFFFFLNNCLVADIHKLQILEYILAAFSINGCMYIFKRKDFTVHAICSCLVKFSVQYGFFFPCSQMFSSKVFHHMHLLQLTEPVPGCVACKELQQLTVLIAVYYPMKSSQLLHGASIVTTFLQVWKPSPEM